MQSETIVKLAAGIHEIVFKPPPETLVCVGHTCALLLLLVISDSAMRTCQVPPNKGPVVCTMVLQDASLLPPLDIRHEYSS